MVFDPNDLDALIHAMRKIATDEKLYRDCSEHAHRTMRDEWNYDLYIEGLEKATKKVERLLEGSE
jgi:glycosyltransferase involved in cell wall biosynthesis